MSFIKFENVKFVYPNGFSAVEDINFEIGQGKTLPL